MTGVWVESTPEFQAAKRERDADQNRSQQQRTLGGKDISVSRYGYNPRAECQECDFILRKAGHRVKLDQNKAREAAKQHVRETGHEVHVIIQDVTQYRRNAAK